MKNNVVYLERNYNKDSEMKKQSQYPKIVTIKRLTLLKKSLPIGWRISLPNISGVSIATIDNFFRGQEVKLSTAKKLLDSIETLLHNTGNEFSHIENKISNLIGHDK